MTDSLRDRIHPASITTVRLGSPHCCACKEICHHIGPVQLCDQHRRTTSTVTIGG